MGIFSWLGKKALEQTNPLYAEWFNNFTFEYEHYMTAILASLIETNRIDEQQSQQIYLEWEEEIKKEIAVIVTDENPIIGLRASAFTIYTELSDYQMLEKEEFYNNIHDILENYDSFAETINQLKYEGAFPKDQNIRDHEPGVWLATFSLKHAKLHCYHLAISNLKDCFDEYPEKNYLHYLHASSQVISEYKMREASKIKNLISEHELMLLNLFHMSIVNSNIDENPHYEWQKSMEKEGEDNIIEIVEDRKSNLYPTPSQEEIDELLEKLKERGG
ncbi:hypothetical protein OAJ38_03490 [Rhodobiaceae bacterium]|nr:hypothetical protein [Rhodobiaceae bacterium]